MLLFAAAAAAEGDATALFRDANGLMRSGIYHAALLRYRQAAAAGLDTPLLHYNLGVTYYRLGQYPQAVSEFQRAAEDPDLAALATYNGGLAHRAAGDAGAALEAFKTVAGQARQRDLRRLAQRAAASVGAPGAARTDTSESRAPFAGPTSEPVGELRLWATARVGQDDNVYRSPADPYVDLSDPARPTVTPKPQASTFMPVDVQATYVLHNEAGDTDFLFGYRLDGDFYPVEFSNATRVSQQLSIGANVLLGEREGRRRALTSAFFLRDHRETDFDPDSGLGREINGVDISDRFSYVAAGVQAQYGHRLGRWRWGFDLGFERRNYGAVSQVPNYDQNYLHGAVTIDYALRPRTTLKVELPNYKRLYDERPAYDLNGSLLTTNPAQRYAYKGLRVGVVQRLGRVFELDADLLRLDRKDEFQGYDDYSQDALRLGTAFRPGTRLRMSVAAVARRYNYPNAFAFNEPTAGPRTLDSSSVELSAEFLVTRKLAIWAEIATTDVTSTDSRAAYARTQTLLGASWRR
jgi:tetratricopeptide (TPR) repeat protein